MIALLLAAALAADPQAHDHHAMDMPMPVTAPASERAATPSQPAEVPVGDAPPPKAPADHYADRTYDPAAMAAARDLLRREHGGGTYSLVSLPIAEWRQGKGRESFRWNGEAWYGSDVRRAVFKTEGEAERGRAPDEAEVQLLASRPIDAYWDLQAGVRQDVGRGAKRTYATVAVEGLAPYWFDVEAALFLSTRGDLLGRVEASYDQRLTQYAILQPRIELEAAAQDVRRSGIGRGLSDVKADLRLRYTIVPEFAPYVGVGYETRVGRTRRFAEQAGEKARGTYLLVGIASFF
ncbi:copper resistance protein B [Sphingomonas sp. AP4-R1]|uniref:copper resistance protein B n=1 Tax=Sphingomonas sp. AP4-R1 TaxID=2735134 RepID=UPI001493B22E|nr:copper resistance protein B [Sphingomonas sp. AP4-R1]QJU58566.1 copper resistance protein B [Sphingomonas sp. AP4-R1]